MSRRRAWGAEPDGEGGVHFRVYAPRRTGVDVVIGEGASARSFALEPNGEAGTWWGRVPGIGAGARYRYRLAGEEAELPDPVSRFQPDGPFGSSEVVDPRFEWTDGDFRGVPPRGRVAYELHVGTFTAEGTWNAARGRLPELAHLGVTVIEMMPVNEFAGLRGWGYDGVLWFAPHRGYGRPEDLRRFVDDAHRLGIGVILDVVYNHFGSIGNFLPRFAKEYCASAVSEWGEGPNFDTGPSRPARTLVLENVAYWIDEFHFDGFRFDATHAIVDASRPDIITEAVTVARRTAKHKSLYLVGENESQNASLVRGQEAGGAGLDALWNDDFHHTAIVALTRHREGYFVDYTGRARELCACIRHGFLYQGQRYRWQKKSRGTSTRGLPPSAFVLFLENHDQIANYGLGRRTWPRASPGRLRALTTLLLLAPSTPLLFQGQEWNATARFAYFADLEPQDSAPVKAGRATFLQQFARYTTADARDRFPDPMSPETFASCRLDWREREQPFHARVLALHRDLLELRRKDPTLQREGEDGVAVDAAAIDDDVMLVRYFDDRATDGTGDRLLVINLGTDREPESLAEPLLAPPAGMAWQPLWSSDDARYGGDGIRVARPEHELFLPGEAAVWMTPGPREET
jgi:maltooligosyltrehalose trehalohydrolase